jgi:retron-type reverse transcriptase
MGRTPITPDDRYGMSELCRRLEVPVEQLAEMPVHYHPVRIPKPSGGMRELSVPSDELKALQRRILHRLLGRLPAHPAATGFEKGHSIVTNALPHVGKSIVVRMDITDFFPSTSPGRVREYFRRIGWDAAAADALTRLCTHEDSLPQGAPTSPRLSNLVNYRMDARLDALARRVGADYTRYADDMTFSLVTAERASLHALIGSAKEILADFGYRLHQGKKLRIARRNHRQLVTGLVVNDGINLPRPLRRKLRAIRHHIETGRPTTLTPDQLAGWDALEEMVLRQTQP